MLISWVPSLAQALAFFTLISIVQSNPIIRQQASSFSQIENEPSFTFQYATSQQDSTNWIGIYRATGGGPIDEKQDQPALAWEYAPEADGTVFISAASLQPGSYKAFFLASDGYQWLTEPLDLELLDSSEPFGFIVTNVTLHNARQADAYTAIVSGLLKGAGASDARYSINGTSWAQISSDGNITGTPETDMGVTRLAVEAESPGGSKAKLTVDIPVRDGAQALVDELRIMTYNLWHGGTRVSDFHNKQVRFIVDSNADIVGLQESTTDHAERLAKALGWFVWQDTDVGVISRYPIDHVHPRLGSYSGGVRVNLDGNCSQLNLWNVHLGYDPYGPYDFCFDGMSVDEVLEREAESGRTPQIIETMTAMKDQLASADKVPVVLLGDFNAPSHLDWTPALKEKNCGYSDVPWPTSEHPVDAGMVDSFREAHPAPEDEEGITWSPIFLDNNGRPEPLDRIDFIYHKSDFEVLASRTLVVGDPSPEPNHENNEWTSDHAAVMTIFKLSTERCT
ncbi:endonuclease/Exonuclease/phosphatase family protein [Sarocladium implicatum]|nr:endonuclease/Exonuclease/phosphatase family protein [Sarocladium implicatum]